MTKRMLIDATHAEETRVVVAQGNKLEEFDFETSTKKQLKGNIYLAKVTRVEPSLQAAFVDYGGNRHGFLAFNEIHPDYYRIPVEDREALLAESADGEDSDEVDMAEGGGENVETVGGDDADDIQRAGDAQRHRLRNLTRQYKIQEVIKRRQILLVQVVKEERGNKGAALTTYLSLAGRYCVLMPNTARGGGISRKITNPSHRKRLKSILSDLEVPDGMAVILRTAGVERSRVEMRRDYDYLRRLWDEIRELTLKSTAPSLIYEEGNVIKRALRDLYTREIEEVVVDGEEAYKTAKELMKTMIPSHARRVQRYADGGVPLFQRYQIEAQLDEIHDHIVNLPAGGYIVLSLTEALVAIDVNSGRSTRERNIEQTALRTNLEAASEVARQLRLRDLAGLVVIDFIDMDESKNNAAVERRLKEAMKLDRARIQVGRISPFGLLELSRQRLRPSILEASTLPCTMCGGSGMMRSTESAALRVLRAIEEEGLRGRSAQITVRVPGTVALYLLNQKRTALSSAETKYTFQILIAGDDSLVPPAFEMDRVRSDGAPVEGDVAAARTPERDAGASQDRGRSKRRRRGGRSQETEPETTAVAAQPRDQDAEAKSTEEEGGEQKSRRRRGRRGGRRRSRPEATSGTENQPSLEAAAEPGSEGVPASEPVAEPVAEKPAASQISTAGVTEPVSEAKAESAAAPQATAEDGDAQAEAKPKPRRRRRSPRPRRPKVAEQAQESEQKPGNGADPTVMVADGQKPVDSAPTPEPVSEMETRPFVPVSALVPEVAVSEAAVPEAVAASPNPAPARRRRRSTPKAAEVVAASETPPTVEVTAAPETQPDDGGEPRRGWWNRILP
ncbi:MAG: Rne/Rng family ribonuclease, partial [Alphaproteobacteria bacterium]